MILKRCLRSLVPLILGFLILTGMLALMEGPLFLKAAPGDAQAQPIADIVWNQIYTGTLDGTVYGDLYFGGGNQGRGALVDIDNDNDLDMFFITEFGGIKRMHFYRNDGNASAASWTYNLAEA